MCGICGKICLKGKPVTEKEVTTMADAIKHRGPDDSGVFISPDKRVGLGHRRLAIIDLSPLGHQPMHYKDRYTIVFNGEIYNYLEKREELEKLGHRFVSHSDTEVILALYDQYKEKCVDHLRGMFAIVIYDAQEQQLFCARDRVGKKPFKYFFDGTTFMFGSELKAILTQPEYTRQPDYLAIHHYLTLQYVPAPLTGFKDIFKLPPAHYLTLDLTSGELKTERYWKLDYSKKQKKSEEEWCKEIIDSLDESVRLRMISDVPLGAFLSGGIDSSAVVALMAKNSPDPIKTFSIGFTEQTHNELGYAKQIAEIYGTDHTEFTVEADAVETLPLLVTHYEEPYADSSALPTYHVSRLARESVTVALNGDGGDENFAGYTRYSIHKFASWYDNFMTLHKLGPLPVSKLIASTTKNEFFERAYRFALSLSEPSQYRYGNYICYFTNHQKEQLYGEKMKQFLIDGLDSRAIVAEHFDKSGSKNPVEQAVYADFMTYLPDDLLAKVDIATMIVSLEGRSPFLDHKFLELTAQIPADLKLRGRDDKKYILKKALKDLLPHEVMYRRKMGFSIPLNKWFKTDLREYAQKTLLDPNAAIASLFDQKFIAKLLDTHAESKLNYSSQIWALITLEHWFQIYFPDATSR